MIDLIFLFFTIPMVFLGGTTLIDDIAITSLSLWSKNWNVLIVLDVISI
jgi:hypothetical protein